MLLSPKVEKNQMTFREITGLPTLTSGSLLVPKWATIKSTAVFTAFTKPDREKNGKKRGYYYLLNYKQKYFSLVLQNVKKNTSRFCFKAYKVHYDFTSFLVGITEQLR